MAEGRTPLGASPGEPASPPAAGRHPKDRLRRTLGLQDAVFLLVAGVVGSGIFLAPPEIARLLPHPGLILAAWLVGGLLSLAGALANAELAGMFPHAGGDYVYLREAFHPAAGFVVGWLSFFAIFSGTVATLAVGFSESLGEAMNWQRPQVLLVAVLLIALCSLINWLGVRWGALANNVTGWVKVIALAAFVLVAPLSGEGEAAGLSPLFEGAFSSAPLLAFLMALSPVLFSYLGWNGCVYVASEIRDPARNITRSLFIGLAVCTVLYMLLNGVYLLALSPQELGEVSNAGEASARVFFGEHGARLVSAFVLVSILGTLNATVLTGPRIAYAMAIDGLFLPGVDRVSRGYATPSGAILLQALTASLLVLLLQSFPNVLNFTTFGILLATSADVLALYRLRRTQPGRHRPYRALGYPVFPALYIMVNMAVASALLVGSTRESLISLAVLASGLPFYYFFSTRRAPGRGIPQSPTA